MKTIKDDEYYQRLKTMVVVFRKLNQLFNDPVFQDVFDYIILNCNEVEKAYLVKYVKCLIQDKLSCYKEY